MFVRARTALSAVVLTATAVFTAPATSVASAAPLPNAAHPTTTQAKHAHAAAPRAAKHSAARHAPAHKGSTPAKTKKLSGKAPRHVARAQHATTRPATTNRHAPVHVKKTANRSWPKASTTHGRKASHARTTHAPTRQKARPIVHRTTKPVKKPARPAPVRTPEIRYTNWAGYQADVTNPQSIRGSWVVPKAKWPGRDGYSAMWVGLGGGNASQGELVQAGTESDSVCIAATRGRCTKWKNDYYAWLETYPTQAQERITNLALAPGDTVDVTVTHVAREGRSTFTLCNRRTHDCVGADRKSPAPKGVAEAVLERTSGANGSARALANVGAPTFTGVTITGKGGTKALSAWHPKRVTMFTNAPLTTTGALNPSGDAFSVSYQRAA